MAFKEATNICKWSLQIWHPEEAACHLNSHKTTKHTRFVATTQHATFRSTNSSQLKGRAQQDSSENTSVNEQTIRNKNTLHLCTDVRAAAAYQSLDTCGACVLVVWMFVQLSVCIIKCISLSPCACSQLFRWLNSWACLHLYAICECLWFIVLTVWTLPHDDCCFLITEQELGAQIDPTAFSGSLAQ